MSTDFGNIEKLAVQMKDTKEYTFYDIEGNPTLIVSPATESNRKFFNAALKASRRAASRSRGKVTVKTLEKNREQDRILYPKFVVKGWRDVVDAEGNIPEFNEENCHAFLLALPDELFDDLRIFCGDYTSFAEDDDEEPEDGDLGEA